MRNYSYCIRKKLAIWYNRVENVISISKFSICIETLERRNEENVTLILDM